MIDSILSPAQEMFMGMEDVAASVAGGGGAPAWHPDDDLTDWGVYLLADADDITLNDTTVAAWANRGTADVQFKQGTESLQPLWSAEDGVDFDGADDRLVARNGADSASVLWSGLLGTNAVSTMVCVFNADAIASNAANAWENDCIIGDSSGAAGLHLRSTPVWRPYLYAAGAKTDEQAISTSALQVGAFRKIAHVADTPSLWTPVNDDAESSGTIANGASSSLAEAVTMGDTDLSAPFNGKIKLLAIRNTALSAEDLLTLRQNLMTYFGIE